MSLATLAALRSAPRKKDRSERSRVKYLKVEITKNTPSSIKKRRVKEGERKRSGEGDIHKVALVAIPKELGIKSAAAIIQEGGGGRSG